MIIYHGTTMIIKSPDVFHSYRNLDFGKGFYVTTVKKQAERWAFRKAEMTFSSTGIVNVYQMKDILPGISVKSFPDDLNEWIDFVCACRDGSLIYKEYDMIKGKVADDQVYRVVNLYRTGVWDKKRAIEEMKPYDIYDQIAFISQKAIDALLVFQSSYEVK
ncbi:MAG: DUF3990 domain-containing protein [Flexilinea sp.]|nr:DUF3990 domain-containing protein [Flexilinea sp.]